MAIPEIRDGLSYDDVLIQPQRSTVNSRSEVDLSAELAPGLELSLPITGAAMDTVTETTLATALSAEGGLGVIHRFLPPAEQADMITRVRSEGQRAAGAVGIADGFHHRAEVLADAGSAAIVVDVAHGHMERCIDAVADLAGSFDLPLIAGNVATGEGALDLAAAGADCVKVGVGPGSHCTTRRVAGAGVPQLTAVMDAVTALDGDGAQATVIADGGIQTSGGLTKALIAGADAVMLGGLLSGTTEAPGEVVDRENGKFKLSRGMASQEANDERTDRDLEIGASEGVAGLTPYRGDLSEVIGELAAGVRSGLSYCGGRTLPEARDGAVFIKCPPGAKKREGAHSGVLVRGD
jgi:inosine-5''-monophosphate dehydrogenase (EC 1.1.1.205)